MKENSLEKNLILKKRNDIAETLKSGKRFNHGTIRIILLTNPEIKKFKVAFLVSKRLGRKSVLRNKIKRWFREIFRQNKKYFPDHVQIIFTSPVMYEELNYTALKNDFLEVVRSEKFTDFVNQSLSKSDFSV
ncbi:MAG: ribonuclease P protein component [Candidatus Delongbacteria bacterium]|nr:ribonuclease P protein component [Candidatus Delongbacteria bacterium]